MINDKFGLDFTGDVIEITSSSSKLLYDFDGCFSHLYFNRRLKNFGPMYLIIIDDYFKILYQKSVSTNDFIIDNKCNMYDVYEFMNLLGIIGLGLNMEQFVKLYL